MDYINELISLVETAIRQFNEEERYLIENDLSERCICARFAIHLTRVLDSSSYRHYVVDVEYNRGFDGKERSIKRIDDSPITVDLIVHQRGYDPFCGFDNLICMEMKKSNNPVGCKKDEQRLQKMTSYSHGYYYKLGVMLVVDRKGQVLRIKSLFSDGRQIDTTAADP